MISIIAAIADNGVIGRDNTLPWHLPADLKYFRRTTLGHPVIMGRKNFEDIGKPLPGRLNIILSRDPTFRAEGCIVVDSVDRAIAAAGEADEIFVIGGAEVYRLFLSKADKLYLTRVHATVPGEIRFPDFDPAEWKEIFREDHQADDSHAMDFSFVALTRVPRA